MRSDETLHSPSLTTTYNDGSADNPILIALVAQLAAGAAADLLHHILKYSSMPDLSAAMTTSTQIYRVYKGHPSSFARNQMGMTDEIFPRVLHYERARQSDPPVKDWLGEDKLSASYLNLSLFWYWRMVHHHEIRPKVKHTYILPPIDNTHSSNL